MRPLVPGQASLVIDKDGSMNVVAWGRDRNLDANVAQVRQNLALVVDNGVSAAGLDSEATTKWGATVGNQVLVWRSGIGVDRNGGLIYIAGPGLSVNQLAEAVPARRSGAGHGARHQLRLDDRVHLRADRPEQRRRHHGQQASSPT